jgi:hypothetical protein
VAAQVAADSPRDTDASGSKQIKAEKKAEKNFGLWENSKMGFGDFVDIINPLQHIPIIATIYRRLRRRRRLFRSGAGFEGGPIVGVAINVFCYTCRAFCFEFVRAKRRSRRIQGTLQIPLPGITSIDS